VCIEELAGQTMRLTVRVSPWERGTSLPERRTQEEANKIKRQNKKGATERIMTSNFMTPKVTSPSLKKQKVKKSFSFF
jgi:hypothetical protein